MENAQIQCPRRDSKDSEKVWNKSSQTNRKFRIDTKNKTYITEPDPKDHPEKSYLLTSFESIEKPENFCITEFKIYNSIETKCGKMQEIVIFPSVTQCATFAYIYK